MKIKDFKIGSFFWTGAGKWKCFDIGRKTVIAIKWEITAMQFERTKFENGKSIKLGKEILTIDPDKDLKRVVMLEKHIFYKDDFMGCCKTRQEYLETFGDCFF